MSWESYTAHGWRQFIGGSTTESLAVPFEHPKPHSALWYHPAVKHTLGLAVLTDIWNPLSGWLRCYESRRHIIEATCALVERGVSLHGVMWASVTYEGVLTAIRDLESAVQRTISDRDENAGAAEVNLDMKKRFMKRGYAFSWPVSVAEEELRLSFPDTLIRVEQSSPMVWVSDHVEQIRWAHVPYSWRVGKMAPVVVDDALEGAMEQMRLDAQ